MWNWIVGFLVWLSADPVVADLEAARASAAMSAARASLTVEAAPKPESQCDQCKGSGFIVMPDGHRVKCPKCNGTGKKCPDGKCPK